MIGNPAWIEFLRNTGANASNQVDSPLSGEFAICDATRMEVLAGARDKLHLYSPRNGDLAAN